ncbi:hypothetical protein NN561_002983 [Cricetulus griseus]
MRVEKVTQRCGPKAAVSREPAFYLPWAVETGRSVVSNMGACDFEPFVQGLAFCRLRRLPFPIRILTSIPERAPHHRQAPPSTTLFIYGTAHSHRLPRRVSEGWSSL